MTLSAASQHWTMLKSFALLAKTKWLDTIQVQELFSKEQAGGVNHERNKNHCTETR